MSDMHVREGDGNRVHVIFHFPVPTGNNLVGVSWVNALGASSPTTVLTEGTNPWEILTAEKALIESGAVLEHVLNIPMEAGRDTEVKVTRALQDQYARAKAELQPIMNRRFRLYGMTASEA